MKESLSGKLFKGLILFCFLVISDLVTRAISGYFYSSAFFSNEMEGAREGALMEIGNVFLALFYCFIENVIVTTLWYIGKRKIAKYAYLKVSVFCYAPFFMFYFYLTGLNDNTTQLNKFWFLLFLMFIGTGVRLIVNFTINNLNSDDHLKNKSE